MKTYDSIVSKQGQTTIPSRIRDALSINPGSKLKWNIKTDSTGVKYIKVSNPTLESFLKLRGIAKDFYTKNYGSSEKYINDLRNEWET